MFLVYGFFACVVYFYASPANALEIIVDDNDVNTSFTGDWGEVRGAKKKEMSWNNSSLRNLTSGRFRWHPHIAEAGDYTVYAWWTSGSIRSDKVLYKVLSNVGINKIRVDQRNSSNGGRWNELGTFSFSAGNSQYIQVSSGHNVKGAMSADAIRLVKVGPSSTTLPFDHISESDWDATAVRKVLNVFTYGGQSTDTQIIAWADMPPTQAITEMLTFDPHNDKLSPPEDATRSTDGTLAGVQAFWSSDDPSNPVRPDRRDEFAVLHDRANGPIVISDSQFQRVWIQAAATRGLNPFRQKTGFFLTNYLMAISLDNLHAILMRSFYDDAMNALAQGADFSSVLAQGAISAAVALNYDHNTNQYKYYNDGTEEFRGNDDFAREFHQLFFRINGTTEDVDYHENTTIEHTAWMLTGMAVDRKPFAHGSQATNEWWLPGIVFTDHVDQANLTILNFTKHFTGCLEALRTEICGGTADEKIQTLASIAIQHQESLDNLPLYIVGFFADDNMTDFKAGKIRQAWAQNPENLLDFLRGYAISAVFHRSDTIKFRTTFDRNLMLDNLNVLSNEEKFAVGSSTRSQLSLEGGTAFVPAHAVFGGQTGLEASTNSEVFRLAYRRNVTNSSRLGVSKDINYTGPDGSPQTWKKDWASVIPDNGSGVYNVADVGQWLWERYIGDGGKNYDDLARLHVEALLATGLDLNHPFAPPHGEPLGLDSNDPDLREEANRRIGLAINFITMTPYMFAQEGK